MNENEFNKEKDRIIKNIVLPVSINTLENFSHLNPTMDNDNYSIILKNNNFRLKIFFEFKSIDNSISILCHENRQNNQGSINSSTTFLGKHFNLESLSNFINDSINRMLNNVIP